LITFTLLPYALWSTLITYSQFGRLDRAYLLELVAGMGATIALNFRLASRVASKWLRRGGVVCGMIFWSGMMSAVIVTRNGPMVSHRLAFAAFYPAMLWAVWAAWMFWCPIRWWIRWGVLLLLVLAAMPYLCLVEVEEPIESTRVNFDFRTQNELRAIVLPLVDKLLGQRLDPPTDNSANGPLPQIKACYTKYEFRIPMRDGKRLFTAVYVPKDHSQKYPILLMRTPYSIQPYGADRYLPVLGPSPSFDRAGYIFAIQDVRGRCMSEGQFVNMRPYKSHKKGPQDVDESTDAYDTIDWLVAHVPNHNGKVGLWGISYPGFYAAMGMIDAHPALAAVSPQAPIADWFAGDDWHENGAFMLAHAFGFESRFDRSRPEPTSNVNRTPFDYGTPDGYSFFLKLGKLRDAGSRFFKGEAAFWDEALKHGNDDDFWQTRDLRPHLKNIRPAVMTVGGWFDDENLFGALEVFRNIARNSPGTRNRLVIGPWAHGGWSKRDGSRLGNVEFHANTAQFYREQIELPFFEHYLKGKQALDQPPAWVFETGTNVWRKDETWPPKQAKPKTFYFHAGRKLSDVLPAAKDQSAKSEAICDEYVSDPERPVPYTESVVQDLAHEYMTGDQRFAAHRPDVLVYSTDVLEEDVTLAGPLRADLYVSTTGTDSDWIVKLIDVYPDNYPDPSPNPTGVKLGGYQQLVRGAVQRGKFRESLKKPEPFVPGTITPVKFAMHDVCHCFRSGHRIMVQVQSTWFPLVDRNPQVFMDIYSAKESDFHPATQRVYRSSDLPSGVLVRVMP
jgi:putative CocE/NonD family hydrolase